ncbi:hypothetical protein K402DRAFT_26780 [Aulographum hederae CBS 113979]|uniref:Ankyrin n=1 Tax=Aulographum hederae CBS 113979 TaxID=1176131 RepID=A0A6G1H5T2_9PEZI|nr:hypothetical protein K402DRAFT_26780 [Aulographum hederae CBS 113979]
MSAADYRRKSRRPLLAYAVAPRSLMTRQQYSGSYKDQLGISVSSLATVRTLLKHGESPNVTYSGRTVWEDMWISLLEIRSKPRDGGPSFPDMSVVLDVMHLMIKAGANPNARAMYHENFRPSSLRGYSCLFAVVAKLDGPQTARLEVAKRLVERGAHFCTGEKIKIEQDEGTQWAYPLVKDCQERDGPTVRQWKKWGAAIKLINIRPGYFFME